MRSWDSPVFSWSLQTRACTSLECRGCTSVSRESCSASGTMQLTSLNGSPRERRCLHDAHEFVALTGRQVTGVPIFVASIDR
jgi:hypothetical protein